MVVVVVVVVLVVAVVAVVIVVVHCTTMVDTALGLGWLLRCYSYEPSPPPSAIEMFRAFRWTG